MSKGFLTVTFIKSKSDGDSHLFFSLVLTQIFKKIDPSKRTIFTLLSGLQFVCTNALILICSSTVRKPFDIGRPMPPKGIVQKQTNPL